MIQSELGDFRYVYLVDFEFHQPDGCRPKPMCMVAREYLSGKTWRVWEDELVVMTHPPFHVGKDALFVAYYASAEMGCFLALGWPDPANILDLYVEFRNLTNGRSVPCGSGLLGRLSLGKHSILKGFLPRAVLTIKMRLAPHRGTAATPQHQTTVPPGIGLPARLGAEAGTC